MATPNNRGDLAGAEAQQYAYDEAARQAWELNSMKSVINTQVTSSMINERQLAEAIRTLQENSTNAQIQQRAVRPLKSSTGESFGSKDEAKGYYTDPVVARNMLLAAFGTDVVEFSSVRGDGFKTGMLRRAVLDGKARVFDVVGLGECFMVTPDADS